MILTSALAYTLGRLVAENGQQVVLTKRTTLAGANPAPNPPVYEGLVVDGPASAGATAINMKANPITGRLIAGDQFTIAGDFTTYTVTAQVISPSTADTLTAVPFAPALAHPAVNGAAVTLAPSAVYAFRAIVAHFKPDTFAANTAVLETDKQVRLLKSALPSGIFPIAGDLLTLNGNERRTILTVKPVGIADHVYAYYLHVRT